MSRSLLELWIHTRFVFLFVVLSFQYDTTALLDGLPQIHSHVFLMKQVARTSQQPKKVSYVVAQTARRLVEAGRHNTSKSHKIENLQRLHGEWFQFFSTTSLVCFFDILTPIPPLFMMQCIVARRDFAGRLAGDGKAVQRVAAGVAARRGARRYTQCDARVKQ